MIRCMLVSTDASAKLTDAAGLTAYDLLKSSIDAGDPDRRRVAVVETPQEADVILFAESHRNDDAIRHVLQHATYRTFPKKCVVHCGMDYPEPLVPGLYPSIDNRWAERVCCEGSPYLASLNPYLDDCDPDTATVDKLAHFMGACDGKPIRENLARTAIRDSWQDVVVHDSGAQFVASVQTGDMTTHQDLKRKFVQDLVSSKFVLCPAGFGPSSFRIFEAMQAGRAPVIIADTWTPPAGPDWTSFSLHVPERDIERIPQLLADQGDAWKTKGKLARQAWDQYFDPATFGPYIVERAAAVLSRANSHQRRRARNAWLLVNGPRKLSVLRSKLMRKLQTARR